MKYLDLPISDCHIHTFWDMELEKREALLMDIMKKMGYETATILANPFNAARKSRARDFLENLVAFYLKSKHPDKFYIFLGLSPSYEEKNNTAEFFLKQVEFYLSAGFDGIKMLEGRPNQRHICGNYGDEKYSLVFDYAEKNQIPITLHTSASAHVWKEGGSLYGKTPTWRDYYDEMDALLNKHPKLRINIAHFFFATEYIDLAGEFLDKYENVFYDLTPNQFMYLDFQKKPDEWKEFFIKYQDRIMFGTDTGSNTKDLDGKEAESLVHMVRGFFEEHEPFCELGYNLTPIPLDENILRKFYKDNMMKFYQGKSPKKVAPSVMKEELDFVKKLKVFLNLRDLKDLELIETVF